jgi:hypothetical protein
MSKIQNGKITTTRTFSPYPKIAAYIGSGDPKDENNFGAC